MNPKIVENLSEEDIIQISCGMFHMGAVTSGFSFEFFLFLSFLRFFFKFIKEMDKF